MNISVIGVGYVGLVTGSCFCEMGNKVICVDNDEQKIRDLNKGILPIYEHNLQEIVDKNLKNGLLSFGLSIKESLVDSDVCIIAVGTPPQEDGSVNLQYIKDVAQEIGQYINEYTTIIIKSTVPVGTSKLVQTIIQRQIDGRNLLIDFDVVSNPEFLQEGSAVDNFMKPDRIIIGTTSDKVKSIMKVLYAPFSLKKSKLIFMSYIDAELTKYTANAMLATKISFINEISRICDKLGVDIENVRKGIGSDDRIGYSFIYPGVGYGGSCFPKDVQGLIHNYKQLVIDCPLLSAVEEVNHGQKEVLFHKITNLYGDDLSNYTFGFWGLSFKPNTDDIRESPALVMIHHILYAGGSVRLYDPIALSVVQELLGKCENITYCDDQYDTLKGVSALVLMTEWKQFRQPNFRYMKQLMDRPVIFDGRNQYEPTYIKDLGFLYHGIGR